MDEMQQTPYGEIPVTREPVPVPQERPKRSLIPTGSKELVFGFAVLLMGMLLLNSLFFGGGFNLGFSIFAGAGLIFAAIYLMATGTKPSFYSVLILALDLAIIASFSRSNDALVDFVMVCFLLVSTNLALCLMAGKNRFTPSGITSLGDTIRTVILMSTGKLPAAVGGLVESSRKSGSTMKKAGAALLGVLVALPLLCILIPLLMRADAAFEGLLDKLPSLGAGEIIVTLLFGLPLGFWFYLRGVGLRHSPAPVAKEKKPAKGIHILTVNTVLIAVSIVYVVYLVSQLAYFSGGFAGVLPEEFTVAEYARRGFFEMAWICLVNLLTICLAVGLCRKKAGRSPLLTRLLCLFVGLVTLFLVVSASAKMFMYIGSFGLTRLRVLTEVIMVFMGITTLVVCCWLFLPKLPYMKVILVTGLLIGAVVAWADVDTVVARYNVEAYQSGKLETVDMETLTELGYGAVPYIAQLRQDQDPKVAAAAREYFFTQRLYGNTKGKIKDFRYWNYALSEADPYLLPEIQDVWSDID